MPGIAWQALFMLLIASIATGKLRLCKGNNCSSDNSLTGRLSTDESTSKKSNISQHEYVFKAKQLFESNWRNRVKNNGGRRKFIEDLSKNQLLVLKPKRSRRASDSFYLKKTHHFSYYSNASSVPAVQPKKDRTVDAAELRFILEPKKCHFQPQLVTITVLGKDHTLEVDPCEPRWNSINLPAHALQPGRRTSLRTTCKDCIEKGVAYTKPHINVILTEKIKRPQSRRQMIGQKKYCMREKLSLRFRDTPSFRNVVLPATVDIGLCDGLCDLHYSTPREYPYLYNAIAEKDKTLKRKSTCCVPYDYKNLQYLVENGAKLAPSEWEDAIAVNCNCE